MIDLIAEQREDPIRRKNRWEAFYNEPGGLRDILGQLRAGYFMRMSDLEPGHVAQLQNLAIAAKITEHLDSAIKAIIAEGKVGDETKRRIDRIQNIPENKRRWIG